MEHSEPTKPGRQRHNPCENNGTCYDLVNSYRCACSPGYIGRTCSTPYCNANNPCRNGATCYGAGQCLCPTGFVGDDCSVDLCDLLNCQNGGSCVNESCVCPPGVVGARCDLDLCSLMICMNGGNCSQGTCACPSGFTGRLCEIDIDDCVDDPCEHDGTCDDHPNGFTCRCLPGFDGELCSETISYVSNVTNSTHVIEEPLEDRWYDQVDAFDMWFFVSCVVIFVLLLIIIILSICLYKKRRGKKGQEQPAPEAVAPAAEVGDVVGNGYYSIKKRTLNNDYNDPTTVNDYDDPTYEYASSSATQEHEYSQPYMSLDDPDLAGASVM